MKRIFSAPKLGHRNSFPSLADEDGCMQREFRKLPPKKKQEVMNDVYGTLGEESFGESVAVISDSLCKFDHHLERLMEKSAVSSQIRLHAPNMFESETFRLGFLRTDNYDEKAAVQRFLRFFERKNELFGEDKLGQEILFEDLDDADIEAMRHGGFQPLPQRDRNGRQMFFSRHNNWKYKDAKNLLRAIWYVLMTAHDNDSRGVVIISYQNGPFLANMFDRSVFKEVLSLFKAIPIKLAGYHFCFDDVRFRMVWGLVNVYLGKDARLRARDHEGSHAECRTGLMSFGIPVESLPINAEGLENNTYLQEWIEGQISRETIDRKSVV